MVFQLAWVGRLVAGFVNHMCGCPTRMGGPRGGGLRHVLAWKPVQINLYRGPRGRGLVNKVRCPTRMGGPRGGGLWHTVGMKAFRCIRLLEWAAGGGGLYSTHVCAEARTCVYVCPPWGGLLRACAFERHRVKARGGWGLCKGKPHGRFRDGRVRGAQLIQVIGA